MTSQDRKQPLDEHEQLHARNNEQGIVRDDRGQEEPADKERAQQSSSRKQHGETDPPIHPKPKE